MGLVPWQDVISLTSLLHQYDFIVVTLTYLRRHWYRSMADNVCHASQNFSDITNCNSFKNNFRFTKTNDYPHKGYLTFSMCVCSNSRNDVPGEAQRYGTIAAHTRRRASVLVVFVVFCVHMYSFAGLIRRTPPPTFNDTAITDRHSDTTIFQLRAHWVRIFWSIGSEKSFGHVPPVGLFQ